MTLLGAARDPATAGRALALLKTDTISAPQKAGLLRAVAGAHPDLAFDWAVANRELVESFLEVRQLSGGNGVGYYFSATDRDQAPGEFKFMSQGALQVGSLTLWFVILANDGQDTVAVEALAALQTAVHRRTGLDQL